ncbi:DUF1146 family protein [Aureibacillus halotolerans]|uniref:Putative integral membrane protein (TIGR02327 family) n=1 Tax=Aureibacillus halotolerans TaxID=1508390 RepID=A0A4R6U2V8_9BACI|nr:DUF1146 family protein [Aureibacillus halotolerans]TDQ38725.1 putative integral membrane protein (TIGR02327 family) [Aureibacillus halotolerans]
MFPYDGAFALVSIVVHLVCFAVTWWALQCLKLDAWFKSGKSTQIRVLFVLLTICIGAGVASFLMDYYLWSSVFSEGF